MALKEQLITVSGGKKRYTLVEVETNPQVLLEQRARALSLEVGKVNTDVQLGIQVPKLNLTGSPETRRSGRSTRPTPGWILDSQ